MQMAQIETERAAIVANWNSGDRVDIKYAKRQEMTYVEYMYSHTVHYICIHFRFSNAYTIMTMQVFSTSIAGGDSRGLSYKVYDI